MNDSPDSYNLLDRPWIPVLYRCGKCTRVGIRKAERNAGKPIAVAETDRCL